MILHARLRGFSETANVHLISLEGAEEMPADTIEIVEGDEEGIKRSNGQGPTEVVRDEKGRVTGVAFRRCLRVYDEDRKFSPLYDDDEKINSLRHRPSRCWPSTSPFILEDGGQDVERMRGDWPKVDPITLQTTAKGVFVAGDLAHGTRLLIDAVASGKAAARSVYQYLTGNALEHELVKTHVVLDRYRRERGFESIRRVEVPTIEPAERLKHPENVVEIGYSREEAMREASRCLDCGVTPVFDGSRCVLCGGCADVCPTECLKLISLDRLEFDTEVDSMIDASLGEDADLTENSAILKDEDRCIRCALCAIRCPVDAISMERVTFSTNWSSL
ncbi:MAG: 4Fe-4S binding protein [Acidobacteria bacterium]|nr:4Fe-4S binding protein [Acidobacteriota bacterium]